VAFGRGRTWVPAKAFDDVAWARIERGVRAWAVRVVLSLRIVGALQSARAVGAGPRL